MIACVTTVKKGAMPQFTIQVYKSILKAGKEALIVAPKSKDISIDDVPAKNQLRFDLPDNIRGKKEAAKRLAYSLMQMNVAEVWFCDETTTSLSVVMGIMKHIPYKFFVHDARPHKYYFELKRTLRYLYFDITRRKVFNGAKNIVLMSNSSKSTFICNYPHLANKTEVLLLGAHVPQTTPAVPSELENQSDYFMFFGTIERYKNVYGFLQAYKEYNGVKKAVIAGRGELSPEENKLYLELKDSVTLINRFISDGEMIHLFENARCVVLPYIEASQSGVLSMAYHFGCPVVVSSLPGLAEFVVDGVTGFVCKDTYSMTEALTKLDNEDVYKAFSSAAKMYSKEYLDFDKNITALL